jgi:hypothetical protein
MHMQLPLRSEIVEQMFAKGFHRFQLARVQQLRSIREPPIGRVDIHHPPHKHGRVAVAVAMNFVSFRQSFTIALSRQT